MLETEINAIRVFITFFGTFKFFILTNCSNILFNIKNYMLNRLNSHEYKNCLLCNLLAYI